MVMVPISALAPMIRAGKLRGMAVLSAARASVMPDLPTFGERGLPDPHGETWYGVFAPAKTPAAIVQRLNAASVQAISQPELVQALRDAGYETGSSTPENLAATVKADLLRWARVVREAKIQLD
jgi:tripartite-type tricarboxylate transporter receptor subunit TctC